MGWEPVAVELAAEWLLQLGPNEDVLTERQVFLLGPVVVAVAGLVLWYVFAKGPIARARLLASVDPFDPSAGVEGPELVAVDGRVRVAERRLTAPLSGEECVAYEHEDQVYRYTYKYDEDRRRRMRRRDDDDWNKRTWSWETTGSESGRVPFRVETDAGPVAVDPDGAHVELPVEADEKTSRLGRLLYAAHPLTGEWTVSRRLAGLLPFSDRLVPERPRREVVRHLDPDEAVLVVGEVTGTGSAADGTVRTVTDANDPELFRVTTRSLRRLRLGAVWDVLTASLAGLVVLAMALAFFLVGVSQGVYW